MKTSSVYHGFALQKQEQNEKLKQEILKICNPEKLYLLGLANDQRRTETLFSCHGVTKTWTTHYYLLVLMQKSKERTLSEVQDKIENNLQHFIPVTALVLCIEEFVQWLLDGHCFAKAVLETGMLLYQQDKCPLPQPGAINEQEVQKRNEQLVQQTKVKVQEFIAGAELYILRKQYSMAAFMLHQAAEQALRTRLIVYTGLRINTHNIDRLLRYCSMFDYKMPDIFSASNQRNNRLLQLLQKAYIDARYKEDYCIKEWEVIELAQKVKYLSQQIERHTLAANQF
jgi:HEPN domain-containing protein